MKLQNNSRIQTKQLNNLSDSWELKFIFGLVNSNRQFRIQIQTLFTLFQYVVTHF